MEFIQDGLFLQRPLLDGVQYIYRFNNGYGASVVRHMGSYGSQFGLWELAVIYFDGDDWHLSYSTDITDDVIGELNPTEVNALLLRIMGLDSNGREYILCQS